MGKTPKPKPRCSEHQGSQRDEREKNSALINIFNFEHKTKLQIQSNDHSSKHTISSPFSSDQIYSTNPKVPSYPFLSSIISFLNDLIKLIENALEIGIPFLKMWHLYCLPTFPELTLTPGTRASPFLTFSLYTYATSHLPLSIPLIELIFSLNEVSLISLRRL